MIDDLGQVARDGEGTDLRHVRGRGDRLSVARLPVVEVPARSLRCRRHRVEAGIAPVHDEAPETVAVDVGNGGELGVDGVLHGCHRRLARRIDRLVQGDIAAEDDIELGRQTDAAERKARVRAVADDVDHAALHPVRVSVRRVLHEHDLPDLLCVLRRDRVAEVAGEHLHRGDDLEDVDQVDRHPVHELRGIELVLVGLDEAAECACTSPRAPGSRAQAGPGSGAGCRPSGDCPDSSGRGCPPCR